MECERARRVAVSIRWRLGDEIMAIPVYEAIKRHWPGRKLVVHCNYPELLIDNPHVDRVNGGWIVRLGEVLGRRIVLRSGPRDTYRLAHYCALAGVPVPASRPKLYYKDWSTPLMNGIPADFVCICSGATWPSKRWPRENWQALCRILKDAGWPLVELGHREEGIGEGIDRVGKTSVRDAAAILHAARLLVCCDSGLMHLALAAGTPVLALFGPTDPNILVRDEPLFHAVRSEIPCGGCWNISREMTEPGVCPRGRAACLERISAADVARRAINLVGTHG